MVKMEFHFSESKRLLAVLAVAAMAFSIKAQDAGQPIIFSTPQKADDSGAPTLAPKTSSQPDLPDGFDAPQTFLKSGFSSQSLPMPQVISPTRKERQSQEDRRNWALMTPAEILGVAVETNTDGKSQVERYLERQNHLRTGATNDLRNDNVNSPWNFSLDQPDGNFSDIGDNDAKNRARQNLNNFLDDDPKNRNSTSRDDDSDGNLFGLSQSQRPSKPDLAQQAAMERFRQLLEPRSAFLAAQSPNGSFLSTPKTAVDPNLTQPEFTPNPAGASFLPVTSDLGKPTGLTPLPTVITPISSQPLAAPAWAPQAAPWLSQQPQPFTIPQRKF
jgi:hypothetical protein